MSTRAFIGSHLRNWVSLVSSDAATRASIFVVYVLVGRELGTVAFGRMALALSFFYVFQIVAGGGLKTLLIREVAKAPEATGLFLANAQVVTLGFSGAAVAGVVAAVAVLDYSAATSSTVVLVSVGLLPFGLSAVYEAVLQGHERMSLIARATVPLAALRVVAAFALLLVGLGLKSVVLALFVSYAVTAALECWYVRTRLPSFAGHRASGAVVRRLIRASIPFLGIDVLVAVTSTAATLLLSKFGSETDVALFVAAAQLTVPVSLVLRNAVLSQFPGMSRAFMTDPAALRGTFDRLLTIVLTISVPAAVALSALAAPVLELVYDGPEFASGARVVRIAACQLVVASVAAALGPLLFAGLRERVNLRILAVDAVCMLILGPTLTSSFGLMG